MTYLLDTHTLIWALTDFENLPATHHKDPFDRMLIWQALCQEYSLITIDKNIRKYISEGLQVVW